MGHFQYMSGIRTRYLQLVIKYVHGEIFFCKNFMYAILL